MLKIKFGGLKGEITRPSSFFDIEYEEEWFEDNLVKQMVLDVDKSQVISAHNIISPVLGAINCSMLSGGVKNLILAYETNNIIDASFCGNNCAKWILEIAKRKDLTISLYNVMQFNCDFEAFILNNNKHISNYREYIMYACLYL